VHLLLIIHKEGAAGVMGNGSGGIVRTLRFLRQEIRILSLRSRINRSSFREYLCAYIHIHTYVHMYARRVYSASR
jgi:hypothetical protein